MATPAIKRFTQSEIDSQVAEISAIRQQIAEIGPEDVICEALWKKAVGMLDEMLDAKVSIRVPSETPEERAIAPYTYRVQPNPKAVLPAVRMILETRFGKPRQQIQVSGTVGHVHATTGELVAQAGNLLEGSAERVLDRYQRLQPAEDPKTLQPADIAEVVEV